MTEPGKIKLTIHTADSIRKFQVPTTVIELRSFFKLCDIFRRFVPNVATIASPLSKRLCKSQVKELRSLIKEELGALEALKEKLIYLPVSTMPKSNRQYSLDIEARDGQTGYVLLQEKHKGTTRQTSYWSKTLTKQEKNLDRTYCECLTVV